MLRPLRLEDAPAVQEHFSHWEVVRWLNARVPWPYPPDGAESHIRRCLEQRARGERFFWVLCRKEWPREPIGGIDLWPDDGSQDQRGFWIAREHQRQGLMMEAAQAVTAYAFLELKWPHLWLTNAQENIASHRIKQKQGARLVDRARRHYVSGEAVGEIWRLDREDWLRGNPDQA